MTDSLTKELESAMAKLRALASWEPVPEGTATIHPDEAAALLERLEAAEKPVLVMANGTPFSDYLRNAVPEDVPMDDWTKGYEACKRRLATILLPQLAAYRNPQPKEPK